MKKGLIGLVLAGALSLSGCEKYPPSVSDPEDLLLAGEDERGTYYLVETAWNALSGTQYRLHVKTPDGNNFIFYDDDKNGSINEFPPTFSTESAQEFYNNFVPEGYRMKNQ